MKHRGLIPKGSKLNEHWEERLEDLLVGGGVNIGIGIAVCMAVYGVLRWVLS